MKLNITTLLLASSLLFGSCTDELLNTIPPSSLTDINYYNDANDMEKAVLGIYAKMQSRKPNDYQLLELCSDNLYGSTNTGFAGIPEIDALAISPTNPILTAFWQESYAGIFRANAVISNIDKPKDYTVSKKNQHLGEAKFMRALFYFDLVRTFGAVPKVLTALSIDEARQYKRSATEAIYDQIIQDLNDAIEKLPLKSALSRNRASKEAALALLGKVYVAKKDWTNAETVLRQFFTSYGDNYTLVADYNQLWSLENENNSEVLFSIGYTDGTNGQDLSTAFVPNGGIYNLVSRGSEVALPSWSLHKKIQADDKRLRKTIESNYFSAVSGGQNAIYFPYASKFIVKHTALAAGLDLPILRLADIILLYAEALNENGKLGDAITQLNKIRQRAFGNQNHNYSIDQLTQKDQFVTALLDERQIELAFECERWYDLVRKGKMTAVMKVEERNYNPSSQIAQKVTLSPKDYMHLFPIPQTEIDLVGKTILEQNPGY